MSLIHTPGRSRVWTRSDVRAAMRRIRTELLRRYVWTRRFVIRKVLHADDPPQRLALGIAIAVFFAFTPTIGFQTVLAVAFAWLLGANKAVGVPVVWISNPATFVPIYYPCYRLGRWLLELPAKRRVWWKELAHPPEGWWEGIAFYWGRMAEIWMPLWLGCLIVASLAGVASYFITRGLIVGYRRARETIEPKIERRIRPSRAPARDD